MSRFATSVGVWRRLQMIVRHRTALTLLFLFACMLYWNILAPLSAQSKMDPTVRALIATGASRVDLEVVLRFPPEEFHVRYFQDYGVITGVEGNSMRMRRVNAGDVSFIAKQYWVARVELLR